VGDKILSKIAVPYIIGGVVTLAAVAVLRLAGAPPVVPGAALGAFAAFSAICFLLQKRMITGLLTAAHDDIEETLRFSVVNHPLPLCLINSDGVIAMANDSFREYFPEAKVFGSTAEDLLGAERVKKLRDGDEAVTITAGEGRFFRVLASYVNANVSESAMVYFLDETECNATRKLYDDEKLCYLYLIVDNYEDILQASPDETRSIRAAAIESLVRQFAESLEGSLLRYREGSYQIIFTKRHYEKIHEGKFPILDQARKLETDADFPTSFSIGVGLGGGSPAQAEKNATYALDLARGRGGDQAVVKAGESVEYFGGTVQVIENRNKGKSRVMYHAIRQLISESSNVLVMGHKYADIDSFGAACAMHKMAREQGKEAAVVLGEFNPSLEDVYQMAVDGGEYTFVTGEEASKYVFGATLLIVVDTHVPDMVEEPTLLGKVDKLIVIDHHRKRESAIEGATLSFMEPNASSSSELVTELFQFDDGGFKMGKLEAEMLLGGIFIDTNSFSVKTGSRTFEAAAWLRRHGAETTNVRAWLQSSMEDFRQRASITANAEFTKSGIAISRSDGKHPGAQIIVAQSADELLDIKGIRASFVVGATRKEVVISARSLGDLNVQRIMEKFGGGGHLTMAAAQIRDATIDEVIKKLKKYIKEAEGENL
jgi:c-di-AMP phosphodiesterase-like protein